MGFKKITIITPCYNAEKYIGQTIESVINQTAVLSKRIDLEYIICDGGSKDRTIEIINSYKSNYIKLISEKDSGMYDALSKGLKLAQGDICAYINSGDFYSKNAFDIILDIFYQKNVDWLTGLKVIYNEHGQFVHASLPFKYRKRFFKLGFYGRFLPFVQQESTFWKSKLSKYINLEILSSYKLAGDYYLWYQFSNIAELKIVEAYLGGFRYHEGQLSEDKVGYFNEMKNIIKKNAFLFDYLLLLFDILLWFAPRKLKKILNKEGLFLYDHNLKSWI